MKTFVIAALTSVVGTAALASGPVAPVYEPPVTIAPVASYDWSGAYAGLGVTYGRGDMSTGVATPNYPDVQGAGLSGIAGYNWQNGNMVYGAEIALDVSNRDGTNDCGVGGTLTCTSASDHQASIRGRLGYAMDRSLVFMTAGYGTDSRSVVVDNAGVTVAGDGARFGGAMLGLGYEHALSNDWTVRGDYEHYFYGDETFGATTVDGDLDLVRFSLVRRF
ncbi:outer membrane protein [Pararhodobacter zhoushanensis]|uniref:outer membrane protein n=1 Tax=Pararhodobacter zhoushanensis TaxID=2479545 RepID=UPI000F8D6645|nr:outer membrane beta-barrel protein [Pararhodobacter zhoushanensis]